MEHGQSLEQWISGGQAANAQQSPAPRPRSRGRESAFDSARSSRPLPFDSPVQYPAASQMPASPQQTTMPPDQRFTYTPAPTAIPRPVPGYEQPSAHHKNQWGWGKTMAVGVVGLAVVGIGLRITKPWESDGSKPQDKTVPVAGAEPFTNYVPRALGCVTAALIDAKIDIPTAWNFTVTSDPAKKPHTLDPAVAPLRIETAAGPANLQVCVSDPKLIVAETVPIDATAQAQTSSPQAFHIDASKLVIKIDPTNVAINAATPEGGVIAVNGTALSPVDQTALIANIQTMSTTAGPYGYYTLDKLLDAKNRDGQNGYVALINNALQKAFVASEQQQATENKQTFDANNAPYLKIMGTHPTIETSYLATLKDKKLPNISKTAVVDVPHAVVARLTVSIPKEKS